MEIPRPYVDHGDATMAMAFFSDRLRPDQLKLLKKTSDMRKTLAETCSYRSSMGQARLPCEIKHIKTYMRTVMELHSSLSKTEGAVLMDRKGAVWSGFRWVPSTLFEKIPNTKEYFEDDDTDSGSSGAEPSDDESSSSGDDSKQPSDSSSSDEEEETADVVESPVAVYHSLTSEVYMAGWMYAEAIFQEAMSIVDAVEISSMVPPPPYPYRNSRRIHYDGDGLRSEWSQTTTPTETQRALERASALFIEAYVVIATIQKHYSIGMRRCEEPMKRLWHNGVLAYKDAFISSCYARTEFMLVCSGMAQWCNAVALSMNRSPSTIPNLYEQACHMRFASECFVSAMAMTRHSGHQLSIIGRLAFTMHALCHAVEIAFHAVHMIPQKHNLSDLYHALQTSSILGSAAFGNRLKSIGPDIFKMAPMRHIAKIVLPAVCGYMDLVREEVDVVRVRLCNEVLTYSYVYHSRLLPHYTTMFAELCCNVPLSDCSLIGDQIGDLAEEYTMCFFRPGVVVRKL